MIHLAISHSQRRPKHAADRFFATVTDSVAGLCISTEPVAFGFAEQPTVIIVLGAKFLRIFSFVFSQFAELEIGIAERMRHCGTRHLFQVVGRNISLCFAFQASKAGL